MKSEMKPPDKTSVRMEHEGDGVVIHGRSFPIKLNITQAQDLLWFLDHDSSKGETELRAWAYPVRTKAD